MCEVLWQRYRIFVLWLLYRRQISLQWLLPASSSKWKVFLSHLFQLWCQSLHKSYICSRGDLIVLICLSPKHGWTGGQGHAYIATTWRCCANAWVTCQPQYGQPSTINDVERLNLASNAPQAILMMHTMVDVYHMNKAAVMEYQAQDAYGISISYRDRYW